MLVNDLGQEICPLDLSPEQRTHSTRIITNEPRIFAIIWLFDSLQLWNKLSQEKMEILKTIKPALHIGKQT